MKTKIQIKSVFGEILFEYESEDNSLKKTLEEAVKQNKDLSGANLLGANLYKANLIGADLSGADLYKANLREADLSGADLRDAALYRADLYRANLREADLSGADLSRAYLIGANLREADLYKADLIGAYFRDAENVPFIPMNLPEGDFIAYKKIKDVIVKLKILENSKRSRATGYKCRCDKALVLEFQDLDGKKLDVTEIVNNNIITCTYKVGEIVEADKWDDNRWNECTHGIHFFLDRQSAVDYEC